ncbi:MAG: glycosyltransferase [Opitutales bacterium]|nr:glycosyltransferase [Opitutales bacterium]
MKVCLISNIASHYRFEIYKRMEAVFGCRFAVGLYLAGNPGNKIKLMDETRFDAPFIHLKNKKIYGNWWWQSGALSLVKDFDTFIVLGEPYCLSAWLFCIKARLAGKRVFFWTHGWYGKEGRFTAIVKKAFFKLANGGIFTYGDYARHLMIGQGFDGDKIWPIHNSLAYAEQLELRRKICPSEILKKHFGNDDKTLVFVGRLTLRKQLDKIIDAMAILRSRGQNYNLLLVGAGEAQKELEEKAAAHDLKDRVWFYGACYDERVLAELIYNADLCVTPGDIGLTAIHAQMFGCPCVTHDAFPYHGPEFEAIVPGKTGLFFERGNIEDLSAKISDWFKIDRSREEIRRDCYAEIDSNWNPDYQIAVLKKALGV